MVNNTETPESYLQALQQTLQQVDLSSVEKAAELLLKAYDAGNTVYIFGNGGSGATASHMAGDFVKGVSYGLEKRFKMLCLNDNYTGLSAYSNDISYDLVFVEPLKNFLQPGDVVIGLSGSGNSANVVLALEFATSMKCPVIAFSGYSGGKISQMADVVVHAPIHNMEIAEDIHLITFHMIKNLIISRLHGGLGKNVGSVYEGRVK
jgi:D-sedoheptulose 7-phosphate isomerase